MDRQGPKKPLSVVVGESWPQGVEVVEKQDAVKESDPKAMVAYRLVLGAALLVVGFAVCAELRNDRALLDRIYNLAEWTLLFALSWIAGHHGSG